jgi:hypothetical protein
MLRPSSVLPRSVIGLHQRVRAEVPRVRAAPRDLSGLRLDALGQAMTSRRPHSSSPHCTAAGTGHSRWCALAGGEDGGGRNHGRVSAGGGPAHHPLLGKRRVRSLRKGDIREFVATTKAKESRLRRGQKLADDSVRLILAVLPGILQWAVGDELLLANPAARMACRTGLQKSARQRSEVNPFTAEQREVFQEAVQTHDPRVVPMWFTVTSPSS